MRRQITLRTTRAICVGLLILVMATVGYGGSVRERVEFFAEAAVVVLIVVGLGVAVVGLSRRPPST